MTLTTVSTTVLYCDDRKRRRLRTVREEVGVDKPSFTDDVRLCPSKVSFCFSEHVVLSNDQHGLWFYDVVQFETHS